MSRDRRMPPHNLAAEESLLGALLLSRHAVDEAFEAGIDAGDFYKPAHQHVYEAIRAIRATSLAVDAVTVSDELRRAGRTEEVELLLDLQNATPAISNAKRYAKIVIETAILRRMIGAAGEIAELAYGEPDDVGDAIDKAMDMIRSLDLPGEIGKPSQNIDEFAASVPTEYDWMVPGFMEYGDRMIITGFEGHGKSTLLGQIAVCVASGLHPWTQNLVEPRRVLMVDCENNPRLVNRRLTGLRTKVRSTLDPDFLHIEAIPDGLDLTGRADKRWLLDRVLANKTELLIIGPHYNLSSGVAERGDVGGEDHARQIAKTLREIKNRARCSLILEAHSPHGSAGGRELRPFGSTVWMRWPEFGVGLRQMDEDGLYRLEQWRPPRDVRIWPDWLQRGGDWPWTPVFDGPRPLHPA